MGVATFLQFGGIHVSIMLAKMLPSFNNYTSLSCFLLETGDIMSCGNLAFVYVPSYSLSLSTHFGLHMKVMNRSGVCTKSCSMGC